jgi:hypothetical protein
LTVSLKETKLAARSTLDETDRSTGHHLFRKKTTEAQRFEKVVTLSPHNATEIVTHTNDNFWLRMILQGRREFEIDKLYHDRLP